MWAYLLCSFSQVESYRYNFLYGGHCLDLFAFLYRWSIRFACNRAVDLVFLLESNSHPLPFLSLF